MRRRAIQSCYTTPVWSTDEPAGLLGRGRYTKLPRKSVAADANRKIEHLPQRWQDRWRNQFWYSALRSLYLALRRQEPITDNPWPTRVALSTLGRSLEILCANPLFNKD